MHPDYCGVVRTVTIKMRPRDAREKVLDQPPFLQPKPNIEMRLGVQRLCVILPVEEQGSSEVSQHPVQDVAPPAYDEVPSELESDEEFHGFGDDEIARAKDRRQKISDHDS